MHQTVREFFLREDGHVANSRLRLSKRDAHVRIATSCLRYLILCTVNTPLQKDLLHPEQWNPEHYEKYVGQLNKWPLVRYALSHLKQHMHDCGQAANVPQLVFQLYEGLADSPASCLLESWIASHLDRDLATREEKYSFKDFKNNLLHAATRMRYSHVVEILLIAKAEIEARLQDKTPLMVSAEVGDVATARVLLGRKAHLGAKEKHSRTALHLAAANGHSSTVNLLVSRGAKIDAQDKDWRTALHVAASSGHDSTVQLLVQTLGADKKARDKSGQTALHHAACNGHDTVVQLLIGTLGIDKEVKDPKLRTALHYAAALGREDTVELLVNTFKANREDEDCKKWTALHFAAALGQERTVRMLVNNLRVSKEAKNNRGQTALDLARRLYVS
jgi:ankyrin repeat protein